MEPRLEYPRLSPAGYRAMLALNKFVESCGLEHSLLELIKIRASQINGCAYCIDMHTIDARAAGESEQRIYLLDAWREAPFYSDRERAALAWTEAVTLVSETHVPDEVYEEARRHFSEEELVNLTWAVVVINGWNRVAISFRSQPGHYKPRSEATLPFFRSAARGLHVPTRLTPEPTKHEGLQPRASERPRVGCCEELGRRRVSGVPCSIRYGAGVDPRTDPASAVRL